MSNSTEFAVLANARANTYRFLAAVLLAPPTDDLLTRIRAAEFRATLADWVDDAQWNRIRTESLNALVLEYNRLFVVPGDAYVPPYESVYTDVVDVEYSRHMVSGAGDAPTRVGKLLWGPSTVAVEHAYAEAGFVVARAAGEPPDHLGIELQFLARLCNEQVAAWSANAVPEAICLQHLEREFLQAHPLRFVAALRARLDAASAHPFYRACARLCESFLQSSVSLLAE